MRETPAGDQVPKRTCQTRWPRQRRPTTSSGNRPHEGERQTDDKTDRQTDRQPADPPAEGPQLPKRRGALCINMCPHPEPSAADRIDRTPTGTDVPRTSNGSKGHSRGRAQLDHERLNPEPRSRRRRRFFTVAVHDQVLAKARDSQQLPQTSCRLFNVAGTCPRRGVGQSRAYKILRNL